MTRRIFIDLESTGDGSNIHHGIVEISAKYYEDEVLVSEFHGVYGHDPTIVYSGGINYKTAAQNSQKGFESCNKKIGEFVTWLDKYIGDNRAFFIAYNCKWDSRIITNWFKKNKIEKKYFYDTCLCVMALCACKFDKFMNLGSCGEKLGIEIDPKSLHAAEYDVTIAVDIYERISTQLKAA